MRQSEQMHLIKILPFWEKLRESERNEIVQNTVLNVYPGGQNIHGGSGDCTGVIAVKKGRLRVYLMSDEGKEVTLFRLLENDFCLLSASCIMKNISFDIHVQTEEPTEIFLMDSKTFDRISKENQTIGSFMTELISMRFSEAMWVMEQILFMKLDRRLAIFLLDQAGLEGGDSVTLTHEQIASHMGTAREVISRMLKYFVNEGILKVSRKGIQIIDRKKLAEYI